jgi:RNA polymerase sigma-70 factor, ECF subfamily
VGHLRVLSPAPGQAAATDMSDPDAIYRAYAPYVARVGFRILGSDQDLDDLVQDTFIQALRGISGLREPAAIRGWLARITVRLAVRRLRRRRLLRMLHGEKDVSAETALVAQDATPEDRATAVSVYRILENLPAADRAVWVLRHIEGEQLQQIPQLCGCSLSTAQRRLRRAEQAIQKGLGHA